MFIGVIVSGVLGYQYKQTVSTSARVIIYSQCFHLWITHSILHYINICYLI